MLDFDKYAARYGEFGVQAIIERLERYDGIYTSIYSSLEERWNTLMQSKAAQQFIAA